MVQLERIPAAQLSDEAQAWACLLHLAQRASRGRPLVGPMSLDVDAAGQVHELPAGHASAGFVSISPNLPQSFSSARALDPSALQLLSMFVPLVIGRDSAQLVVAHLGQSADGYAVKRTSGIRTACVRCSTPCWSVRAPWRSMTRS
jgi:hypothetical protein